MLKGKLKLPDKTRRVFPDRLGSLVSGVDDDMEDGNRSVFESGEELEILEPNGAEFVKQNEYEFEHEDVIECDQKIMTVKEEETYYKVRKKLDVKDDQMKGIAADEKRSDLQHELSLDEINLEKLKTIASTGIPDGGGIRSTTWKLLLGYLPPSRALWEKELTENRQKYANLKEELLSTPTELNKSNNDDNAMSSADQVNLESTEFSGPLTRHEISQEDHPLSVGTTSPWHHYFKHTEIADQIDRDLQRTHPDLKFFSANTSFSNKNRDAMRNVLLLFAKLNPAIRYVQGMNEVLAPIFYVFSTDPDEQNAANAEADSFACFVRLLSDSVDHFCEELDKSPVGILSTLDRLTDLLKANDEELWRHLEFTTKVRPQFYGFRWITLLLTQEFEFQSVLRIWDSLLSNPCGGGIQDILLRICCTMLLCVRSRLLSGDFADNLRLLQHYPEIEIDHLIEVARDLCDPET